MTIAIFDMDSILVDLINPWFSWYNKESGDTLTIDDHTDYHVSRIVLPEWEKKIYDFFKPEDRYKECPPIEGAREGIQQLLDAGVSITVATAVAGDGAKGKFHLLEKIHPALTRSVYIGKDKHLLKGDFFVDDSPANIVRYRNAWKDSHILTIEYPYNGDIKTLVNLYAESYKDTKNAWNQITKYILENA